MDKSNRYAVRLADGTLIGPVDLHKVKQLLRSGQVTIHDRIALIGETFLPIHEYPELTAIAASSEAHPPEHNHAQAWGLDDEEDVFAGLQPIRVFFPDPEEPETAQVAQYSGMLEKVPFSSLFYFFFSRKQTGRLLLKGPQHTREIFFEKGLPQGVELLTETDDLEQRLLMRRACTLEQLSQGLQKLASLGGSLGNHLIALGFIDPYLLYEVLQEQFREQLLSCFSWLEGRYFFFVN